MPTTESDRCESSRSVGQGFRPARKNGIDFETVSIVKAGGNTNTLIEYTEVDFYPLEGISYYRLKQYDRNGEFSFTKLAMVNYKIAKNGLSVYPNPSNGEFKIDLSENTSNEVLVVIKDISGQEIFSKIKLKNHQVTNCF